MSENREFTLNDFHFYKFSPIIPVDDLKDLNGDNLYDSFPYWRKYGLMPFFPKGGWGIEISMTQLIWLRILDHLRALSYTVKDTQLVTEYIFKDAYDQNLSKQIVDENHQYLLDKKMKTGLDEQETQLLEYVELAQKDPLLLYSLKLEINHLTELLNWCIYNYEDASFLIYAGGKIFEQRGSKIDTSRDPDFNYAQPHIKLSMKYFLTEFVESESLMNIVAPAFLNEDEQYVIKQLRKGNLKEIRISILPDKTRIDSTEYKVYTGTQAKEIRKALGMGNYEEVTITTNDAKSLTFKKVRKKYKDR
jgi:hypothetical protein